MLDRKDVRTLIRQYACRGDLRTWDPYDIWKTPVGYRVKALFNRSRWLGGPLGLALAAYDLWVNNRRRWCYARQEYPIVRAQAALALLNLWKEHQRPEDLRAAREHIVWLLANSCKGYEGLAWGLGFPYAVGKGLSYDENTPLSTMTPYVLEAVLALTEIDASPELEEVVPRIARFFIDDLVVMRQSCGETVLSYAPFRDRVVHNANSYTMYSLALTLGHLDFQERENARRRIRGIWSFLRRAQEADGSWLYAEAPGSFIDCFHSCFVLKNIVKADRLIGLPGAGDVVSQGWQYIRTAFFDQKVGLYRRFSRANKPGLIRFDLYDNAEVLGLAKLLGEEEEATRLQRRILEAFQSADGIYSGIDLFGRRVHLDHLRWAVMPFLLALSMPTSSVPDRAWRQGQW